MLQTHYTYLIESVWPGKRIKHVLLFICDIMKGPSKIVLGWSPNSDGTAQKNGKHAVVELSVPILPEASHLLPLIKGGLPDPTVATVCVSVLPYSHKSVLGSKVIENY